MSEVIIRRLDEIHPRPNNPKTHPKNQIEKIAKSIARFGFTSPILIDREDKIVAGHGRHAAALHLELKEVPTICLSNLEPTEARAYLLADNKLSETGWDKGLLADELKFLSELENDLDPTLSGFDWAEIEGLIGETPGIAQKDDPDDKVPPVSDRAVTRLGDIWEIGPHRLICGDALVADTFSNLLGDQKAAMIFADSPYNVPISGHVSGKGKVKHREFAMASGEMSEFEFTSFLTRVFMNLAKFSTDGSIHFQCIDWRHASEMLAAGAVGYRELKNICVWSKTNAGMGSLYRSAHELICVFKAGTAAHVNNISLGKNGRHRTNVWTYAGANSFGRTRDKDLAMHPTVKPVALVMDAILDCSNRKDIVLDPFAGSGTTIVAAERSGRRGYAVEIDPLYCDVMIRRMQSRFKLNAKLSNDGRSFDEIAHDRISQTQEIVA